ncbi:uncharacterized protein LOC115748379 isoform X2 [Rhodamnia argentea]|uniref:Uncharacterized protein LOC115748379 isoform X2 n=1 Tax=Rhodamnia argentea TaxID=178133 RepID=A0A8B8Q2X0_9MYRT|nr:uncharacterized protein LOC115748379 isoform X2 [Rhodamnia argentea]
MDTRRSNRGAGPPPKNGRKDNKDEDLLLFRELHRREKDRAMNLLLPVSDEFEPNGIPGNYPLPTYKAGSGRNEFLTENDKNDYDWLKTPPATPLFPSLEMEANAGDYPMQREIPILQPLSRFAGAAGGREATNGTQKSPRNMLKTPPASASVTQKNSLSSSDRTNRSPSLFILNQKMAQELVLAKKTEAAPNASKRASASHRFGRFSCVTKSTGADLNSIRPSSINNKRGMSPLTRSTIPAQFPGFSNETPSNLRKDRPASTSRGRPSNNLKPSVTPQPPEPSAAQRRQSCSPSVTRGRKLEPKSGNVTGITAPSLQPHQRGTSQTRQGSQVLLGSRMVEKVLNARKAGKPAGPNAGFP